MRELWQALMKVSEGGVGRVLRSRFRPTDGYRVWSVDSPVSRVVCATRPYRERWTQGRGIILGFTKSVPSRAFRFGMSACSLALQEDLWPPALL